MGWCFQTFAIKLWIWTQSLCICYLMLVSAGNRAPGHWLGLTSCQVDYGLNAAKFAAFMSSLPFLLLFIDTDLDLTSNPRISYR